MLVFSKEISHQDIGFTSIKQIHLCKGVGFENKQNKLLGMKIKSDKGMHTDSSRVLTKHVDINRYSPK